LNHALDGADRQAKHFGGLAGAEILGRGLCHVHRLVLWMVGGAEWVLCCRVNVMGGLRIWVGLEPVEGCEKRVAPT
jgi:hypothetical protein